MKINEVAKLSGITVRTLQYYDKIGLLKPEKLTEAGYRIYSEKELEKLQQILFFRELNFPLEEIKKIITSPGYDRAEALNNHRALLIEKRNRLDELIALVEQTLKGDKTMSFKEFDTTNIDAQKEKYAAEVKARYGSTALYKESAQKTAAYGKEKWQMINEDARDIFREFSKIRHLEPSSDEAQVLVARWHNHINENYYNCTKEILGSLGTMYVADERFTKTMDEFAPGTTAFISKAIAYYITR